MALNEVILRAKAIFPRERARRGVLPRAVSDEQPLRSELFSVDQLELHAKRIAGVASG